MRLPTPTGVRNSTETQPAPPQTRRIPPYHVILLNDDDHTYEYVIEMLKATYRVQDVIDYSGLEHDGLFLEGTGAMVFDHLARVAYTARSNRADPVAFERFSTHFNFEPMLMDTADEAGALELVEPHHHRVLGGVQDVAEHLLGQGASVAQGHERGQLFQRHADLLGIGAGVDPAVQSEEVGDLGGAGGHGEI